MTSQQSADAALAQWQALRALPPEIRIERLMTEFFAPTFKDEFEESLKLVAKEMRDDRTIQHS